MSFTFTLASEIYSNGDNFYFPGTIQLGNDSEHFRADATSLSRDDYRHLWLEALRLTFDEKKPSVLVTSIAKRDAESINFFEGWVLYPLQEEIVIQNRLFFLNGSEDLSTAGGIALLVGTYKAFNDDGQAISTWHLKNSDVRPFYENEKQILGHLRGELE